MSYEQYGGGYSGRQEMSVSAGTAFKIGFFGAFGAAVAGIVLSVIFFVVGLLLAAAGVGFLEQFN
ncbi:hypothetical protein AB0I28_17335 [Phytomonospora sp. NPDC050363]|uniref:hypothetical protein n=1 Tax=Phytomonospora sp. NPDC050363 TaxID=3155642 RepID=UPI0033C117A1